MFLCSSLQKDKNGSGFSWLGGQGDKSKREVFCDVFSLFLSLQLMMIHELLFKLIRVFYRGLKDKENNGGLVKNRGKRW